MKLTGEYTKTTHGGVLILVKLQGEALLPREKIC